MSVTKARLDILCEQIRNLNGEKINVKGVTGKYTMDGFLAGAMGVDLELEDLREFTKSKEYMYFHEIFNPGAQIFLTVFIPGFGDLLDSLEIPIYATEAVRLIVSNHLDSKQNLGGSLAIARPCSTLILPRQIVETSWKSSRN